MKRFADATAMVTDVLSALGARAAGLWRVEGRRLAQAAFVPGEHLPADVAQAFSAATRSVPLDDPSLGIVAAATTGAVRVSRAAALDPATGSGRWLRAFGAERSVAVPIADPAGTVVAVFSVAMPSGGDTDDAIAERIRAAWHRLDG
jgi:hypothetical protein